MAADSCSDCHEDIAADFSDSRHKQNDVSCVSCHGGDPNDDEDTSMDPAKGFRGSPSRREIPKFCSGCHSDRRKMAPYGIRTDQYDQYKTSQHGMGLARGDSKVAVCTDCHGVHRVLPKSDPESKVFPKNIPDTCGRCHADEKLMKPYKLSPKVNDEYAASVHGKSLLESGDLGAPNCAVCHGVHGASPPGVDQVANVCGRCHINEKKYFKESVHKKAMDKRQMKECVSCHGNHAASRSGLEAYDEMCVRCHKKEGPEYALGQKVKQHLWELNEYIEMAMVDLEKAEHLGLDTSGLLSMVNEAEVGMMQSLPLQHTLSHERLEEALEGTTKPIGQVRSSLDAFFERIKTRRRLLVLFLVILLITVVLLIIKRRQLLDEWEAEKKA